MTNSKSVFSFLLVILIVQFITSCSPTTAHRSGKYSSADKRGRSSSTTKEKRTYTHSTKKSETKESKKSYGNTRDELVESAKLYQGTNYQSGGKTPETGFDCSGFTSYIYKQNGIPIAGSSDQQAKLGAQKPKENLLPGDLVFFGNEQRISHVAIVSSNDNDELEIVHSTTSAGVKIDNVTHSEYWQSRFLFGVDIISQKK